MSRILIIFCKFLLLFLLQLLFSLIIDFIVKIAIISIHRAIFANSLIDHVLVIGLMTALAILQIGRVALVIALIQIVLFLVQISCFMVVLTKVLQLGPVLTVYGIFHVSLVLR